MKCKLHCYIHADFMFLIYPVSLDYESKGRKNETKQSQKKRKEKKNVNFRLRSAERKMHLTYKIICNYYCIASICASGLAKEKEAIEKNKKTNPTSIFVVVFLFVCFFTIFGGTSIHHRNGHSTAITILSGMFMARMQFPSANYFLRFLQGCHFMILQKISPVLMAHLLFHSFL